MNRLITTLFVTGLALGSLGSIGRGSARAADWDLDGSHVTAQFSVRHMMVSTVRGQFDKVTGTAKVDDADLVHSSIDLSIDVNSINTREPKRDAHLKSPDFFDSAKNPTITFKSTKIEKAGKNKFKVTGDLTMHGATHPVTLATELTPAVKDPWGMTRRGVSATGKLSRKDWGLTWNKALDAGGMVLSDEVTLSFDAELVAKAAPAKAPAAPAAPAKAPTK